MTTPETLNELAAKVAARCVENDNGCLIWTGAKSGPGYGSVYDGTRTRSGSKSIPDLTSTSALAQPRDTDGSPEGEDGEAGSVRSTTAGAEGIAERGSHD